MKDWQIKISKLRYNKLIKTPEQIEGIRRAGKLNSAVLDEVSKRLKVGMTTEDINTIVHDYTIKHGGIPAPLNYEGFPKSVCTSVNEVVCHGIPSDEEVLVSGDIINVDVTTILDGYYADASRMFIIGKTTPERKRLVQVAKECMELGINAVKPFCHISDIGYAITNHAHKNGFYVVRDLTGHGVGLKFHEDPDVEHYAKKPGKGMLLMPGMVITVEPMINVGTWEVFEDEMDGWTVVNEMEEDSAQWEKTILITENGVEVLSE